MADSHITVLACNHSAKLISLFYFIATKWSSNYGTLDKWTKSLGRSCFLSSTVVTVQLSEPQTFIDFLNLKHAF